MPMNPESMVQQCTAMMKSADVDEGMINRWRVMMHTPIFLDSPCAVYGQAATLGLSDEQKQKLVGIENEARAAALSVLTDGQRKELGDVPERAMPMIEVCGHMRGSMMPMMQMMMGGDESNMMQKMQQMMGGTPSEEPDSPQGKEDK